MFRLHTIPKRLPYRSQLYSNFFLQIDNYLDLSRCSTLYSSIQRYTSSAEDIPDNHVTNRMIKEQLDAIQAPPLQFSSAQKSKRREPLRVSNLYDALIYQKDSKKLANEWKNVMAVTRMGKRVNDDFNKLVIEKLESCRSMCHGEEAIQVLDLIEENGFVPSAHALILAMESCIPAEDFQIAEQILLRVNSLHDDHPSRSPALLRSARTLLAITYSYKGKYEDALRVMSFANYSSYRHADIPQITMAIQKLNLAHDTVAWGVLVKALTKLNNPRLAVDVINVAMKNGVGMTDSLLHLTVDALRMIDRWQDARWLFHAAVEKGIQPKERTLASILLALTSRSARKEISREEIEKIVDLAESPSARFLSTALVALSAVGSVGRCERIFDQLAANHRNAIPEEHVFSLLIGAYGNHVDIVSMDNPDTLTSETYEDINTRIDTLWKTYMKVYRLQRPAGPMRYERSALLSRYLRAKVRCFKTEEAVKALEEVVRNQDHYPFLEVKVFHVTTVLGAIELQCDVEMMKRLLQVMNDGNLRHDIKSVAFVVGTYIADGNLEKALNFARKETPPLLAKQSLQTCYMDHHPILLLRRLEILASGLKDAGIGKVKDLDHFIAVLKGKIDKPTGITPL